MMNREVWYFVKKLKSHTADLNDVSILVGFWQSTHYHVCVSNCLNLTTEYAIRCLTLVTCYGDNSEIVQLLNITFWHGYFLGNDHVTICQKTVEVFTQCCNHYAEISPLRRNKLAIIRKLKQFWLLFASKLWIIKILYMAEKVFTRSTITPPKLNRFG